MIIIMIIINTTAQKDKEKKKWNIIEDMRRMKVEENQEGK